MYTDLRVIMWCSVVNNVAVFIYFIRSKFCVCTPKNIVNTSRQLDKINTFNENTQLAMEELDTLDDLMELARGFLQQAWDKGLEANNGTYGHSSLAAIKTEIDEIAKTMVDLANTEFNDNYIFGGANTITIFLGVQTQNLLLMK